MNEDMMLADGSIPEETEPPGDATEEPDVDLPGESDEIDEDDPSVQEELVTVPRI